MIQVDQAVAYDPFELVLRAEDEREVSEGWRERIAANIDSTMSFRTSTGRLVALAGIQEHAGIVTPWLLCSPLVGQHRASLVRYGRRYIQVLRRNYRGVTVGNFIPKDAHANRRFVTRLGFSILESPSGFDFFFLPHV